MFILKDIVFLENLLTTLETFRKFIEQQNMENLLALKLNKFYTSIIRR